MKRSNPMKRSKRYDATETRQILFWARRFLLEWRLLGCGDPLGTCALCSSV